MCQTATAQDQPSGLLHSVHIGIKREPEMSLVCGIQLAKEKDTEKRTNTFATLPQGTSMTVACSIPAVASPAWKLPFQQSHVSAVFLYLPFMTSQLPGTALRRLNGSGRANSYNGRNNDC